ncbi:MAG: tRNA (adenosine(37)-N6)-threonylcarbamoyltransferase complex ATPase subunit type 1 TsaE [Actinobacteria bacterium]|nr:tRNA (adenosine(37)-N6)-threonylcarbamoyltransferase complex ATPase subunit type 1 TsaE [Actinomycetota bacterium]
MPNGATKVTVMAESPDATRAVGRALGTQLRDGDVVLLQGPLGAGKTVLVKGIADGLGLPDDITSPTYTIVRAHPGGRLPLTHVDLFRLSGPAELDGIDWDGILARPGVVVVEWPERAHGRLPSTYLLAIVAYHSERVRRIALRAVGPGLGAVLAAARPAREAQ